MRRATCLAVVMLAAGCALWPQAGWPPAAPPQAFFAAAWARDVANQAFQDRDDYLLWVARFYRGWLGYPGGWLAVSAHVLAALPPASREAHRALLARLGRDVAAEWAKRKPTRRIHNRTVATWGEVLTEAGQRGAVAATLDSLAVDVEAVLSGRLNRRAITMQRYFPTVVDDGNDLPPGL